MLSVVYHLAVVYHLIPKRAATPSLVPALHASTGPSAVPPCLHPACLGHRPLAACVQTQRSISNQHHVAPSTRHVAVFYLASRSTRAGMLSAANQTPTPLRTLFRTLRTHPFPRHPSRPSPPLPPPQLPLLCVLDRSLWLIEGCSSCAPSTGHAPTAPNQLHPRYSQEKNTGRRRGQAGGRVLMRMYSMSLSRTPWA